MCFCVNLSFNHDNGSFPLQLPPFHLLLISSSFLVRASAHFPRRPSKLRSTIATSTRVSTVVVKACPQPAYPNHGDCSSDESLQGSGRPQKHQGSPSADASISEGKPSSPRASSSPSSSSSPPLPGNALESPGKPATVTFESNGGNQFASASSSSSPSYVQSSSGDITNGAVPSVDSSHQFKQLSHMSNGIKTAFGMVQGWKVIQKLHSSSAEGALLVGGAGNWVLMSVKATKFFAKGLKMSEKVLTSKPFNNLIYGRMIEKLVRNDLPSLAKGFNAFYAAIKVAQFSRSFGKQSQEGQLPHANFIWEGYKVSKSVVSILDVVAGKNGWAFTYMGKGFVIAKKAIGGIGVMVKAVFLSKELGAVVLKRVAISGGTFAAVMGTCQHTHKSPTEVTQSKSMKPLCTTNEAHIRDWALVSSLSQSVKNESLCIWILLFGLFTDDFENVQVNFTEEDDLRAILCLALPVRTDQFPVFA